MHHSDPAGRNVHLSTEHNFSGKSTILIGKRTCTAAFFCNMLDRLDADAVSLSFGGLKNTVLLPDFAVIGILNFDQKQPPGMQVCSDFDLPSVWCSTDTGFERIFQQVGQDQTHVDLIDRKSLRQIELCTKGNAFALCQGTIIADDAICCAVFAEVYTEIRDAGNGFFKVAFESLHIAGLSQCGNLIQLMAHIMPRLPHFFDGGFEILIALLLQEKKLVFLL